MKILVIGGSYFFGRVFVMEAAPQHELTVVNRGTYDMSEFGVRQIAGDRADAGLWQAVTGDYDAVVDFCAYQAGDIENVLAHFGGHIGQYILISTVDVYQRGITGYKDEQTLLETRMFDGQAGEYIAGKTALEREIRTECARRRIPFTVIRPAILYGPFNYAPRESVYIRLMVQQHILPRITDADGSFQFVYVKDAADAVIRCLGNETAYGQSYNLCGDEEVTYELLADVLSAAGHAIEKEEGEKAKATTGAEKKDCAKEDAGAGERITEVPFTIETALAQGLPLPFPLTAAESELCSNAKSKSELGIQYISLTEGMERTCRAFWNVYSIQ
jgi:nucleoside-diphosphate-sugar epimerase